MDLYVTAPPLLGSPLGATVRTGSFGRGKCIPESYFGMLLLTGHPGNVMPNGHAILSDGSIRNGRGSRCAISVIPDTIVHFAPRYDTATYTIPLLTQIPYDPGLVGFSLFMQVVLVPDFNCGLPPAPWATPPDPDYQLVTSAIMRVEVQRA